MRGEGGEFGLARVLGDQAIETVLRAAVDHDDVGEGRNLGLHGERDGAVIDVAERGRHDQHLGPGEAEHEGELALAEDDHQRVGDRAELEGGEMEHGELPPVGQLEGDDVALADAAPGEADRDAIGQAIEFGVGQAHFGRPVGAGGDDGDLVAEAGDVATEMVEQGLVAPQTGRGHGGAAGRGAQIVRHRLLPPSGALAAPFSVQAAAARSASRAMMSFMIWAVPSPICRPSTSRRRCSKGRSTLQPA